MALNVRALGGDDAGEASARVEAAEQEIGGRALTEEGGGRKGV